MIFIYAFIIWTLAAYWLHRLSHYKKINPLWRNHREHHRIQYQGERKLPDWFNFLFWFGSWRRTIDVWTIYTIPAISISVALGGAAYGILIFHYFYEIFFADEVLEHNKKIKGKITNYFAIGGYHMQHHAKYNGNYAFIFTFWDKIFHSQIKNPHT